MQTVWGTERGQGESAGLIVALDPGHISLRELGQIRKPWWLRGGTPGCNNDQSGD